MIEEEPQSSPRLPMPPTTSSLSPTVDTSRPFTSVKEAVAIFGQKLLAHDQQVCHSSPNNDQKLPMWKFSPKINPIEKNEEPDDQNTLVHTVKRLEAELEATKTELKLVKEREEDTEVAVASLYAELHKNMSKMAKAEAAAAAKAAVVARTESIREESDRTMAMILGGGEERERLSGEREGGRGGRGKVVNKNKKKPIVPLVWKAFSRRKALSTDSTPSLDSDLFPSTHVYFN